MFRLRRKWEDHARTENVTSAPSATIPGCRELRRFRPGMPATLPWVGSVGVRRHDPSLAGLDDDEALAVEDELERLT